MSRVDLSPARAVQKLVAHAPGRIAVIYEDRPITFTELADAGARLAGVLAGRGVRRGDRVAYLGLNSPAFFACYLASAWLGAVLVPINYRLTALEVRQILADAGAAAIVAEAGHRAIADEAAAGLALHRLVVDDDPCDPSACDDREDGAAGSAWTRLAAALAEVAPVGAPVALAEADLALLVYTSGTTGKAKGVPLSHGNLWWNNANLDGAAGMRCDDVNLVISPLFHTAPFGCFTARALVRGATSVVRRTIEASRALADLVAYRVTTVFGVPAMLRAIARVPGFATADLSRLAVAVTAGAPAPRPVLAEYLARGIALQQAYGLTEVLFATCVPVASMRTTLGSVGVALPFTEIRIAPEADDAPEASDASEVSDASKAPEASDASAGFDGDRAVAPGEVGEVWVRGPTVMTGYWRDAEATARAMRPGGWFRTGDLGYVDGGGNLVIADRRKDMIIVAGDNVYSGEVERVLCDHPAIAEVAVVGLADETWGESVVAAVTLHDGATPPTLAELRAFAAPHLAAYKSPTRLEVLVALPRNSMGKVDKKALREALAAPAAEARATAPRTHGASPVAEPVHAVVTTLTRGSAEEPADPAAEATAAAWARRLAALSPGPRQRVVVDLVHDAISGMLPHVAAASIGEASQLVDLGLGSLAAVELASRLGVETGLRLPTTLVFDHPTVGALARHLGARLAMRDAPDACVRVDEPVGHAAQPRLEAADDDDLFRFLDEQLGSP
jgi:fatty-acyl-CoA synthase